MFLAIALPSFLAGQGLGLVIGFAVGLFTPGVYRKLKALLGLAKQTEVHFVDAAKADEGKAKADLQAFVKKL